MCAVDDCEPWKFVTYRTRRAAKAHKCNECWRKIHKDESYMSIKGLVDYGGIWTNHKICRHCEALSVWMQDVCNGYPLTMLYSELVEHWREGYANMEFGRLIVKMKNKWNDGQDTVPNSVRIHELAKEMMTAQVYP